MGHLPFACLRFYTLQNLGLDLCHNPERLHLLGCRVWMLHLGEGKFSEMSAFSRVTLLLWLGEHSLVWTSSPKSNLKQKMPGFLWHRLSVCLLVVRGFPEGNSGCWPPGHRTLRGSRTQFLLRPLVREPSSVGAQLSGMEGSPNPTWEEAAGGGKVTSFGILQPLRPGGSFTETES